MHRGDPPSARGSVDHVVMYERSRLQELDHDRRIAQVLLIGLAQVPREEDQVRPAMLTIGNLDLARCLGRENGSAVAVQGSGRPPGEELTLWLQLLRYDRSRWQMPPLRRA